MKVLVFGLPGAGKTTFSKKLAEHITKYSVQHLEADILRKQNDDWDFSTEGRKRQVKRMLDQSDNFDGISICDFVAPFDIDRKHFDFIIWLDTIRKSRYEDTNKVFEQPAYYNKRFVEYPNYQINDIANSIIRQYEEMQPHAMLLGRFQPWHEGHHELLRRAIAKEGHAIIMIRGMPINDKNPYNFETVRQNILNALTEDERAVTKIVGVPNITRITYGRDVGYTIEKEELGEELESISATRIRQTECK